MPLAYRSADYQRYLEEVGAATYIDISRRADPACIPEIWRNLQQVVEEYGPPWVVQIWTKDPEGVLRHGRSVLETLTRAGSTVTLQLCATGLAGTEWEPLVPPNALQRVGELARLIGGTEHITWRYDPIIPGVHSLARFAELARCAREQGIRRGVINFIAPPGRYKRVDRRLASLLPRWSQGMPGYDEDWRATIAEELVNIAHSEDISLACCAESAGLSAKVAGLRPAACGDYLWFSELAGNAPERKAYRGSRPGCGCLHYFDVGNYGCWSRCHRCSYCYAG